MTQISIRPNFDGGAKSEGKVLQHDGDADSRNTCSRNPSRARGRADEQTPTLICNSGARRILRAAAFWGGRLLTLNKQPPPKYYYYDHSNLITPKKFTTPTTGFGHYLGEFGHLILIGEHPPGKPVGLRTTLPSRRVTLLLDAWMCGSAFSRVCPLKSCLFV